MKHIKYPKTPQFESVARQVEHLSRYQGLDEKGEPIYSEEDLPTIKFVGAVKLHGTNAAICWNQHSGIWFQSRNRLVSEGHFGFVNALRTDYEILTRIMREVEVIVKDLYKDIVSNLFTISIYGEWAGKDIQQGVAISNIDPKFYIFGIKISPCCDEDQFDSFWLKENIIHRIFKDFNTIIDSVYNYTTYDIHIDFNNIKESLEKIQDIVNKVEKICPIAHSQGYQGIGEGVVWSGYYKGERLIFKTKGDKHSQSKVKKLKIPSAEQIAENERTLKFAENFVVANRVNQALSELEITDLSIKDMGKIISWMKNDILSEELLTLYELNISSSAASKAIARVTSNFIKNIINENNRFENKSD